MKHEGESVEPPSRRALIDQVCFRSCPDVEGNLCWHRTGCRCDGDDTGRRLEPSCSECVMVGFVMMKVWCLCRRVPLVLNPSCGCSDCYGGL